MPDIHDQFAGIGGRYVVDAAGNRKLVEEEPSTTEALAVAPDEPVKPAPKPTTVKASTDA